MPSRPSSANNPCEGAWGATEHGRVKASLPRLLGDEELLMPTIVQMEVVHYLVKRLGGSAREAIDTFLAQAAAVGACSTLTSRLAGATRIAPKALSVVPQRDHRGGLGGEAPEWSSRD